jgi:acyl-CoA synthetase (AMP-forming)/AMP-acid ligase II
MSIFATGLGRTDANFVPLTPLRFLPRSAAIHPDRTAIVHGSRRISYRDFHARWRRLAAALAARGVGPGDTVSVVLPNVPAMLEAHHGVPMLGEVLNAINTRLDARTIAYILGHGEAKVLITDREFSGTVAAALALLDREPLVIDVDDPQYEGAGERLGTIEYGASSRRAAFRRQVPLGRPRGPAHRRLHRDPGPAQGHHHLGGREHREHRGRDRLTQHPAVALAAVVARPDETWGRRRARSSSCGPARR